MYLLLDIGNSRVKAVCYSAGHYQLLTELTAAVIARLSVQAVYVSSVANDEKLTSLKAKLALHEVPWHLLQSEAEAFGLKNSYAQSTKLGIDRWLAMLGTIGLHPAGDAMVVDAGTAMTIDWLNNDLLHLGGWIIPGLQLQQQALFNNTAKVIAEGHNATRQGIVPGSDTRTGVENGALAAIVGAIRTGWQLNKAKQLVLTGGDAEKLLPYLVDLPVRHDPLLIFRGIARYIDS